MNSASGTDRVWTIPNLISFARLAILLPLFSVLLLQDHTWWAFATLMVLGSSDWLDGYLARRLDQVTLLGQRLDPVADRISIVVIGVVLAFAGLLPWWMVAGIAVVDLTLLTLAAVWFHGSPDLPVTRIGKWRTAALLAGLPVLIVAHALGSTPVRFVGLALMVIGVLGHIIAGAGYAAGMARLHRRAQSAA